MFRKSGTDGSNPVPSSGESANHLSGDRHPRHHRHWPCPGGAESPEPDGVIVGDFHAVCSGAN